MKKLLFFTISLGFNLEDTSETSGVWYIRNYESFFDEVYYVRLQGPPGEPCKFGNTILLSAGTGNSKVDFFLAPFRLFKVARDLRPTDFLTCEVIFAWWAAIFVKLLLKGKIILFPLVLPQTIYKITGKSLSVKIPIWIERLVARLNYWFVDGVITAKTLGSYIKRLASTPGIGSKLIVVDLLPEAAPSPYFFKRIELVRSELRRESRNEAEPFKLIYVGRLRKEKMVDDLIKMLAIVNKHIAVQLTLIGAGDELENLKALAADLNVSHCINFLGFMSNGDLPDHLMRSDVLVSPLTGGSLREAALCGLPIIAYDIDWIQDLPEKENAFILVPGGDYRALADAVLLLNNDTAMRRRLSENVESLAWKLWSPSRIRGSLQTIFED